MFSTNPTPMAHVRPRHAPHPATPGSLCEAWLHQREALGESDFAALGERLLTQLGWAPPIPYSPREGAQTWGARPWLLRSDGQTHAAIFFCPGHALEAPSSLSARRIDHCPATQALVAEAREVGAAHAVITDVCRWYVYDVAHEDLIAQADEPRALPGEVWEALSAEGAARGALNTLRRTPRSMVARQLREWREGWARRLRIEARVPEDLAEPSLDRLVILRALLAQPVLAGGQERLQADYDAVVELAHRARPRGVGAGLNALLRACWTHWRIEAFAPCHPLEQALRDDALAAPLVQELAALTPVKCTLDCVLESFNAGAPTEKLLVRTVPDFDEEREMYLNRLRPEALGEAYVEVDLVEEGYRAALYWLDRLAGVFEQHGVPGTAEDSAVELPPAAADDLFAWSELDQDRPALAADPYVHCCARAFGVLCRTEHQARVVRQLLTLHLIGRYGERSEKARVFPAVDSVVTREARTQARQAANAAVGLSTIAPVDATWQRLRQGAHSQRKWVGMIDDTA